MRLTCRNWCTAGMHCGSACSWHCMRAMNGAPDHQRMPCPSLHSSSAPCQGSSHHRALTHDAMRQLAADAPAGNANATNSCIYNQPRPRLILDPTCRPIRPIVSPRSVHSSFPPLRPRYFHSLFGPRANAVCKQRLQNCYVGQCRGTILRSYGMGGSSWEGLSTTQRAINRVGRKSSGKRASTDGAERRARERGAEAAMSTQGRADSYKL